MTILDLLLPENELKLAKGCRVIAGTEFTQDPSDSYIFPKGTVFQVLEVKGKCPVEGGKILVLQHNDRVVELSSIWFDLIVK